MTFRWIEDHPISPAVPVWTRAFASELLPGPVSPLGWELVWQGAVLDGWRDTLVDRLGFAAEEVDEERPDLVAVFGGYAYLNASLFRVWASRTPVVAANHVDTAYLDRDLPPYVSETWHRSPEAERALTDWLSWVLVKRTQSELDAGTVLSTEARAERPDLTELSDMDVVDRALGLKPLLRALAAHHLNQTLAASVGPGIIGAICDDLGMPTSATSLVSGLGEVSSASPAHGLLTLAHLVAESPPLRAAFDEDGPDVLGRLRASTDLDAVTFLAGLDALVAEVGFRGEGEWEPSGPTMETHPAVAVAFIDRLRRLSGPSDPGRRFSDLEEERRSMIKELREVIGSNTTVKENFDVAVASSTTFIRGREQAKANVARVVHEMRWTLAELGARAAARGDLTQPDDIVMLFVDELTYYADGGLADVREIADRRRAHIEWLRSNPPPSTIADQPPPIERRPPVRSGPTGSGGAEVGDVIFGTPGAAGLVRGPVRKVADLASLLTLEAGEVVVARSIPAAWAPALVGAAGAVVTSGGFFSHGTIIARELGIPMVVRAKGADESLVDGTPVEVDGLAGIVTVLSEVPPPGESRPAIRAEVDGDEEDPGSAGSSHDGPEIGPDLQVLGAGDESNARPADRWPDPRGGIDDVLGDVLGDLVGEASPAGSDRPQDDDHDRPDGEPGLDGADGARTADGESGPDGAADGDGDDRSTIDERSGDERR